MYDVICLSHLRWNFVFQRPQHLLTRCAEQHRVFYVEEPVSAQGAPRLDVNLDLSGVYVVVPHLPDELQGSARDRVQNQLLIELLNQYRIQDFVLWYYTPMALPLASGLSPLISVYDCMDELSAFKGAPPELVLRERQLFENVDLVFTGGQALYEAKCAQHHNVHCFPSSVDRAHFGRARRPLTDPADQAHIARPRLGFFGVIDERMDLGLLQGVAELRPDWQLVMLGPVVKIDPRDLPRLPNLHYLGGKAYSELPDYIAGWDVALLPFAKNESTRFISPTKTPEYLAAGKPVVSTSIRDVVRPYSTHNLARIADTPSDFVQACEAALSEPRASLMRRADAFMSGMSWDATWSRMAELLELELVKDGSQLRRSSPSGERLFGNARLEVG
jgi:UDP-galactopyranose mutase